MRKILMIVAAIVAFLFIIGFTFIIMVFVFVGEEKQIEVYNKELLLKEYGSDIDSALLLFPEDTERFVESTFACSFRTGLLDTAGYIIMNAKYNEDDYKREVERLSNVKCIVKNTEMGVIRDTKSYSLPAYVAIDGFDYVYEYALVDEENCEIIYVLLSCMGDNELNEYQAYLKLDKSEYEIDDVINRFSIYVREDGDGSYIEYSDEII